MPSSNFERRRNCTSAHSTATPTGWVRGANEALGVIICTNGTRQHKLRCRACGTAGGPIGTKQLDAWGYAPSNIEWQQVNDPYKYPPCSYQGCVASTTEYHHFAPRNTFGADAENWPVMPLCRLHHMQWHTVMDGYRWQRKGVAA